MQAFAAFSDTKIQCYYVRFLLDGSDVLHDNLGTLEELGKKTSSMGARA